MKSSNHKTNLWFLGLLAILCFASCVKHEYINRPPSVDDPGNTSGSEYPCDTCGGTDPMERLRWLGQLALQYDTDSINHLSVFRCLTSDGSERFLVAVSAQYPFDSARVYTCQGTLIDSLPFEPAAFIGHGIRYSSLHCIHQNYTHRTGNSYCDVSDPLQDMPWLKHFAAQHAGSDQIACEVYSCQYLYLAERHDGFLINPCTNCTDHVSELYDCLGNLLCTYETNTGLPAEYDVDSLSKILIFKNP